MIRVTRGPESKRGISVSAALFLIAGFITGLGVAGMPPASASSSSAATIAFDSIPAPMPGNVASVGFEATSTSEFGDYATFANNPPNTHLETVDVVMSSWGCETGHWYSGDCVTTSAHPTFSEPITFTIYANNDGAPGANPIGQVTHSFDIPFRPSADHTNCTGGNAGKWYDSTDHTCYNGFATTITFDFSSLNVTLPPSAIYGVSYNTTHYGSHPIGENADCYTSDGGCGYDSLNVGAASTTPTVGTDDDPDGVFLNSSDGSSYCDNGVGGTGTFRLDTGTGCWTDYNPLVRFHVEAPDDPTNLAQTRPNASVIAPGGSTYGGADRETVVLSANVSDPDSGATVKLSIQVAPTSEAFGGSGTVTKASTLDSAGTVTLTFTGLTPNTNYHWRAQTIDNRGFASSWVSFGGNLETATDFRVPQADLSLTKTESADAAAQCPNPVQSYLCVMAGRNLTYTLSATNVGPDDASNVTVTDTLPSETTFVSASGTDWSCRDVAQVVTCTRSSLGITTAPNIAIVATVNSTLRHGPLSITNNAHVTSDVFDPNEATGNDASADTEVHTVPEPPTDYAVDPGNAGNAIASWSPPVAVSPGQADGGEPPIDFYKITIEPSRTGAGINTPGPFDVYPPSDTDHTNHWYTCLGRLGGTMCFNISGLTNDNRTPSATLSPPYLVYTFTIAAHNAVGLSTIGSDTTAQGTPSTNNLVTVAGTTSTSFTTCTTATATNPICIQYSIPSGGGGVFSTQDTILRDLRCTGTLCPDLNPLASFEGHPPDGYTSATNPILITVTWDRSIVCSTAQCITHVYYQSPELNHGDTFELPKCKTSTKADPDPCLKKVHILGSLQADKCTTKAACYGDVQAQILLTSLVDGGIYHK